VLALPTLGVPGGSGCGLHRGTTTERMPSRMDSPRPEFGEIWKERALPPWSGAFQRIHVHTRRL
jgi:hypothetical protein